MIHLYDCTLRDGTQGEGVNFSSGDKIRIARKLDELGVHYIEGGWPGSNPKDMEFFQRAKTELNLENARVAAFGSTRKANVPVDQDPQVQMLLETGTEVVTIFGKTWDLHVRDVLRTTPDENVAMIYDTVSYLKEAGKEVIYDAEHFFDGYRADPDYALRTLKAAEKAGADCIVLCDTNGGSMPWDIERIVKEVQEAGIQTPLGIHTHNDGEVGVANALAAVRAGVVHVQGTINGYGERCGNSNLISIIANLNLKMGVQSVRPDQLRKLTEIANFVSELANLAPNDHAAYVGRSAFAHKGGVHVNAVVKNVDSYQHIDPALVGNRMRVVVSDLSGKDNIHLKREQFGLDGVTREQEIEVLRQIKEMENRGYAFEAADASVELLLRRTQDDYEAPFELIDFTTNVEHRRGRGIFSEATVKVQIGDQIFHEVAEGNGPVNALNLALRKALERFYPRLKRVHLADYKVRILDTHMATAATTRVLIDFTDGTRNWTTVGASPNIIEASWQALADGLEYALLTDGQGEDAQ
ncbi:MAG: citramalate synthase [Caldilineae bacterium]|nr:MAG: citramalate synthase [Caldilineae bacterium]